MSDERRLVWEEATCMTLMMIEIETLDEMWELRARRAECRKCLIVCWSIVQYVYVEWCTCKCIISVRMHLGKLIHSNIWSRAWYTLDIHVVKALAPVNAHINLQRKTKHIHLNSTQLISYWKLHSGQNHRKRISVTNLLLALFLTFQQLQPMTKNM